MNQSNELDDGERSGGMTVMGRRRDDIAEMNT